MTHGGIIGAIEVSGQTCAVKSPRELDAAEEAFRECGCEVVFEVHAPLKKLLSSLGDFAVVSSGDRIPECDLQVALLSLPLAFATTLQSIPAGCAPRR